MRKHLIPFILFVLLPFISNAQEVTKVYTLTFSEESYSKTKSETEFIHNITKKGEIQFDDKNYSIIITTHDALDPKIIFGKFTKKEIELLEMEELK